MPINSIEKGMGGYGSQEAFGQAKQEQEQKEATAFIQDLQAKLDQIDQEHAADLQAFADADGFKQTLFNSKADTLLKDRPQLSKVLAERDFLQREIVYAMRDDQMYESRYEFRGLAEVAQRAKNKKAYEIENGLYHGLTLQERGKIMELINHPTMLAYSKEVKSPADLDTFKQAHPDYDGLRQELNALRKKESDFYRDDYGQPTEGR